MLHYKSDGTLIDIQSSCWRDVEVNLSVNLTKQKLYEMLREKVVNAPGYSRLEQQMHKLQERNFPVMKEPRLVIYPWKRGFRLTWTTYTYGSFDIENELHKLSGETKLALGHIFIDARNGQEILFAPMSRSLETPTVGKGLGVTPLKGPFITRDLNIVKVDSLTYRLRDTTHSRDIITYDGDVWGVEPITDSYEVRLNNKTLPVSEDKDKEWKRFSVTTSDAERRASQQPEVDLHHFVREAYEWYNALLEDLVKDGMMINFSLMKILIVSLMRHLMANP